MKTLKVFISQPMRGIKPEVIAKTRKEAEDEIRQKYGDLYQFEFIDSMVKQDPPEELTEGQIGAWYLGKSIELMAQADIVYFCDGWQETRGCRIEQEVADAYQTAIVRVEKFSRVYRRPEMPVCFAERGGCYEMEARR